MADAAIDLGVIFDRLSVHSRRPRFAFMVLNLLSEAADSRGRAGPLVTHNGETLPVRLWLGGTLARMGENHRRRADMRRRVATMIEQAAEPDEGQVVTPPTEEDLDKAVQERARVTSGANVSRAVSDLVKCGLVKRAYAGRWTGHHNRGGERYAVYTVEADALAALRRGTQLL